MAEEETNQEEAQEEQQEEAVEEQPETKAESSSSEDGEATLINKSAVYKYVKAADMNFGGDTFNAVSDAVKALLDGAIERTKGNGRKTVKPVDL